MKKENKKRSLYFSKIISIIIKYIKILLFLSIFVSIRAEQSIYFDSFQKTNFQELDSLIEINDYYNLSIFLTTNKEIYMGIPPNKTVSVTSSNEFINLTKGVTYDENFLLMVCTGDFLLTKIEIESGIEIPLLNYSNISMTSYPCGAFSDQDYVYITMSHIVTPQKTEIIYKTNINNYNLESDFYINETNFISENNTNMTNITDFEYITYDDYDNQYLEHSIIRIKLNYTNETIGPVVDEESEVNIYTLNYTTKYYYKLPSSSLFSCEIIRNQDSKVVCGYIEVTSWGRYYAKGVLIPNFSSKNYSIIQLQDLESISSSIKLQKLNTNSIIAIVSLYVFKLSLDKEFSSFKLESAPVSYFSKFESADDLYFYNNDFLFTSTGTSNSIYIRRNNSYNYFTLKDPLKNITKVLGFYNELNDSILFLYEFEHNKIVYITLENMTQLYDFVAKHEIIQVISNTSSFYNVSDLIKTPENHSLLELESLFYYVNTKERARTYDKFNFDNESQSLSVFGSDNDWVTFNFYYEGKKAVLQTDMSYGFYIKDCKVTIRTCQFKCGSCNENYDQCSSTTCKKNFAMKRGDETNECYSNDQNFFNYLYYNETDHFEKCYKNCKFCEKIESNSSASNHNCLVCEDNYLKSYQNLGNCYYIPSPFNNSEHLKVAYDVEDDNYTLVDSCPEGKKFRIMETGECVTSCPVSTPYYTYVFNYTLNISAQEENFIGLLYPLTKDKTLPKYSYHKGCYIKCPAYTNPNNQFNRCDCKYAWNYEENDNDILCYDNKEYCLFPDYYYHDDTKECKLNDCNAGYYKFNLECFKDNCPEGTQQDSQENKCISSKPYCYINEQFKTICSDTALVDYPLKYDDTKTYFQSCNYSEYYFKVTTYLYKKICYTDCPIETYKNDTNGRCSCKYYIYYIDSDKTDYECLQETEKCSDNNRYNISDIKECVNTKQECINRGYKIFNEECLRNCPQNTDFNNNNNDCICKYKFYKETNFFTCYGEEETCESLGYPIKMANTNECFKSKEECFNRGYKIFNNICYESCPENSDDVDNDGICLCKYNYINNTNELTCYNKDDSCESKGYNYINLDTNECFTSLESCKNRDLKTFNEDCYSICPRNTKENSTDTSSCICSYYFFREEDNKLNCFEQTERCETVSENYIYTNIETKECFESLQTCITTGSLRICVSNCNNINSPTSTCNQVCDSRVDYVFNDICYKFYCPQGTKLNTSDPTSRTCVCEEGSKINEGTGLTSCVYKFPEIFFENKDNCPYLYNKNCVTKCPENTCLNSNTEDLNVCVDMRPTTKKYNEICIEGIHEYIQTLAQSEEDEEMTPIVLPSGVTLNAYPAEEDINELIDKYPNLTYVDLGDCKDKLKLAYKLPNETKLYILGIDTPNLYGNSTINVFNYEIYLKNGTELEDLSLCNNSRITVTSIIKDLDAAHFYKAMEFYEEGYDIYNKSNLFYQDYCSPAQDEGNDITLVDRAKYYYPSASICNDGCIYSLVDFDSKRFVCKCNADLNEKQYVYEENEHVEKDLKTEEMDQSYLEYFLSLMNYKIFLCINLFFEFESFYYNAGFYISFSTLLISISLMIVFLIKGINQVRIDLYKNIPTKEKLKDIYQKQISRENEAKEIKNDNNISIYKNSKNKKKGKEGSKVNDSKNIMSNKGILNLTLKSHPPPKKESIIRVKTFLEYRRKQKEEEEEEEREKEKEREKEEEEREKEKERGNEGEIKNINNKEKEKENVEKKLGIKSNIQENNLNEYDQSKKRTTIPRGNIDELSKNYINKKKKKRKKNKTMVLRNINMMPVEINPSSIIINPKQEKNMEENNLITDTFDNPNISNIKLKSPTMKIIPKNLDSKNLISLNSENDKVKEIEINQKNIEKTRIKKKWSKTHKNKFKNIFGNDKDSNSNLLNKKCHTTNDDSDLIIDFNFLRLIDRTDEEVEKREYNTIPYLQAIRIDKRSNLEVLISVFANEIGFLNLFCYKNPYSHISLTISVYLFELLLDLTMNCFLYTDDVVSEKYHNDGNLSMFTSLSLSFISNIISSIAVFIIAKLTNYYEVLEIIISSVKNKKKYFDNIIRLMKYIKLRLGIFYFLQLSFIIIMTYYLFIFCTVYHQSQISITINYIVGALTSLAISAGLTVIITILRIISLNYRSKKLYNISRYIYDKF